MSSDLVVFVKTTRSLGIVVRRDGNLLHVRLANDDYLVVPEGDTEVLMTSAMASKLCEAYDQARGSRFMGAGI